MLNATTAATVRDWTFKAVERDAVVAQLAKALTKTEADALRKVDTTVVTYYYRSAPKISGTRPVQAKSSEWLNKKIASGISSAMLQKLIDNGLVSDKGSYGCYTVRLSSLGRDVLAASGK